MYDDALIPAAPTDLQKNMRVSSPRLRVIAYVAFVVASPDVADGQRLLDVVIMYPARHAATATRMTAGDASKTPSSKPTPTADERAAHVAGPQPDSRSIGLHAMFTLGHENALVIARTVNSE